MGRVYTLGKGLHPGFDAAPIVGQLADAISTHVLLDSGRFREGNPIMRPLTKSWPLWYAAKLAVGVGISTVGHLFAKQGHRRTGKVLDVIGGALGVGPAVLNTVRR